MQLFNAMQLTAIFAGLPFLIMYLDDATFRGARAGFWLALVMYIVAYFVQVGCVYYTTTNRDHWW